MRSGSIVIPLARALALGAGAASARGCLKGAVVGAVGGHLVGHGVLGAAAGCIVGHHLANKPSTSSGATPQPLPPAQAASATTRT